MTTLVRLWRNHCILFLAFTLAAALTLFFAGRAVIYTLYWSDPAHLDQQIEGWMTPRYVAHSWKVPPEVVAAAIGIEAGSVKRQTLAEIARQRGLEPEELARAVEGAITRHRAEQ